MKALCFDQFGDPDVLRIQELADPPVGERDVLLRMEAIGLNFADVYRRRGNYHLEGTAPFVLGYEGAGVVVAAGSRVAGFQPGDRVAFADVPRANAELVAVPVDRAIPLPDGVSSTLAASLLLQGLTAQYLTHDSYRVRPGDLALVHAAAGGVGQLLTQIVRLHGGRAIGLTSTGAKAEVARSTGAEKVLLYDDPWWQSAREVAGERGFDVVFDSVGETLGRSLEVTRTGGTVVIYGMAGGDPAPVDPRLLMARSLTLTGGDLWNVLTDREERIRRAAALFEWVRSGQLQVEPPRTFPLEQGAEAHRLIESRQSTGKILLMVEPAHAPRGGSPR